MDADILHRKLDAIVGFLNDFRQLINCHLVNFITRNHFDILLPNTIQDELLQLTDEDLCLMPSGQLETTLHNHHLIQFLNDARQLTLPEVLKNTPFIARQDNLACKNKFKFDHFMGVKKSHEVEQMACAVASSATDKNLTCAIDIGSGRGYLSSLLAMYFGMKVLGFDSSDGNTQSAHKRQNNVKKHWKGLLKKASGAENVTGDKGLYTPLTCHIDHLTNLTEILRENQICDDLAVCGLHTCGDLASHTINMFLNCPQAKVLCLVGCCYHLIEEKFAVNPFRKAGDPEPSFFGFPLSDYLLKKEFGVGRNARTLASQPVSRMAEHFMMPKKALFWRALLQKIIWDRYKEIEVLDNNVGSIAKNCQNFFDYVDKALKRLGIEINISECETMEYERKFQSYEKKMNAYFQFRCIFAPIVETVILLDRLCYILEQGNVEKAKIIELFNPTTSPRCFALIATKL